MKVLGSACNTQSGRSYQKDATRPGLTGMAEAWNSAVGAVLIILTALIHQTDGFCNETHDGCYNGGTCIAKTCVCPSGYSGAECENTVVSVAILVVVCVMPLITWSIVCSYGVRNLRRNKARARRRRDRRRRQQENQQNNDNDGEIPIDDDPPDYYQVTHNNPVDANTAENGPWYGDDGGDGLQPPPHYDDLNVVIKAGGSVTFGGIEEVELQACPGLGTTIQEGNETEPAVVGAPCDLESVTMEPQTTTSPIVGGATSRNDDNLEATPSYQTSETHYDSAEITQVPENDLPVMNVGGAEDLNIVVH